MITDQEVLRLYVVEEKSLTQIAKMMGKEMIQVRRILLRHGVEIRPNPHPAPRKPENLAFWKDQIGEAQEEVWEAQATLNLLILEAKRAGVSWSQLSGITGFSLTYLTQHFAKEARS